MIETDIGDDGHKRRQYVRAIQPSSQAHFHHGDVHMLLHKISERHGGHRLEERGLRLVQKRTVLFDEFSHFGLGNRFSVNTNPLAQVNKMRAGI